jgi:hypothetical protein
MDIIFGSISKEQRQIDIDKQEKGMFYVLAALDAQLIFRASPRAW